MEKAQIVLITLVLYKSLLIGIGFWSSKNNQSGDDFFLGGRGLGPVVAALSYSSSAASAWVLLGLTGAAYAFGVSTIWLALGSISSMFVTWYWIAPRLMNFSREHDLITLSEIVTHGLDGVWRSRVMGLCSLIIVASFTFYVAAQFQGAGKSFASSFDMSTEASIALSALIIMVYTLLGGFWAVSVTDAVQGSLMALAALTMPVAAFFAVGGLSGLLDGLNAVSSAEQLSLTGANLGLYALGVIFGGLAIGIGTYGQPHLMARIMALRDKKAMRQARSITILWYLVVFLGMWFVGITGHILHAGLENSEQIFFLMLDGLFPSVIAALFLAAVLSAIMSTADSQLLSAAAALANDLGIGGDDPKRVLFISRLTIVALVVAAVIVAIYLPDKIFSRVLFAWMALGSAFGPALFFRLAGLHIKPVGLIVSILVGFLGTVFLSFQPNTPGDILERLLPFCLATLVLLLSKDKSSEGAPVRKP